MRTLARHDLKVLYLAVVELIEPKTRDRNDVASHWKTTLNAFSLYFEDRLTFLLTATAGPAARAPLRTTGLR